VIAHTADRTCTRPACPLCRPEGRSDFDTAEAATVRAAQRAVLASEAFWLAQQDEPSDGIRFATGDAVFALKTVRDYHVVQWIASERAMQVAV
jgi:hypothetical protein